MEIRRETIEEALLEVLIGPDEKLYINNPVFYHGVRSIASQLLLTRATIKQAAEAYDEATLNDRKSC